MKAVQMHMFRFSEKSRRQEKDGINFISLSNPGLEIQHISVNKIEQENNEAKFLGATSIALLRGKLEQVLGKSRIPDDSLFQIST